ncbi:MAG: hypothetical protein JNN00_11895 [Chitinophagaceae bacterium]|nr:hypothetical protein [Chitinophagaceae bacterium]
MQFVKRLKSGWTLLKFIRVGLGGLILHSSIQSGHITGIVLGGLFTLFALLTEGVCCAGNACYIPQKGKSSSPKHENIEYEELAAK